MGFKLVRVDATEPCKIPLAVGTHSIGRGKFLDCHDNRVSRNHGQLEVTDDTVRIIALHENPCFFRRKCSENTNILSQNEYIELANGDQFGLVPESYWYELIYCNESLVPPHGDYTPTRVKIEQSTGGEPSVSGSSGNVSQIEIENTERIEPSMSQSTFMDSKLQTEMPTTSPYKRAHPEGSNDTVVKKVKTEPQSLGDSSENHAVNVVKSESQASNNESQATYNKSQPVKSESQASNNESQATYNESQPVKSESQASNNESQATYNKSQPVKSESQASNNESQATYNESQPVKSESQASNNESQVVSNEASQANVGTSIKDSIPDEGIQDTGKVDTLESEKETGTASLRVKIEPGSENTKKTEPNIVRVTAGPNSETVKSECSNNNGKTEPNSQDNRKPEPNSQDNMKPGPSNNRLVGDVPAAGVAVDKAAGGAAAPAAAGGAAAPAAAPAPAAPAPVAGARPREKCMYGAQCYRVNPAHKAQFSHPGDADWALRVPCRWGAACRDIRPVHWRDHDHPPRRDPQERRRAGHGIRVVQRHGNIFYINANSVHFYDDHFQVQDSDGESVDYDYEF